MAATRVAPSMNDCAVTGSPLEKVVPGRRLKVHSLHPSSEDHFSAISGVSSRVSLLMPTRPAKRFWVTRMPSDSWEL